MNPDSKNQSAERRSCGEKMDHISDKGILAGTGYLHSKFPVWFRLIWLVILLILLGMMAYHLSAIMINYRREPVSLSISYEYPESIPYPNVLICPTQQIKRSKLYRSFGFDGLLGLMGLGTCTQRIRNQLMETHGNMRRNLSHILDQLVNLTGYAHPLSIPETLKLRKFDPDLHPTDQTGTEFSYADVITRAMLFIEFLNKTYTNTISVHDQALSPYIPSMIRKEFMEKANQSNAPVFQQIAGPYPFDNRSTPVSYQHPLWYKIPNLEYHNRIAVPAQQLLRRNYSDVAELYQSTSSNLDEAVISCTSAGQGQRDCRHLLTETWTIFGRCFDLNAGETIEPAKDTSIESSIRLSLHANDRDTGYLQGKPPQDFNVWFYDGSEGNYGMGGIQNFHQFHKFYAGSRVNLPVRKRVMQSDDGIECQSKSTGTGSKPYSKQECIVEKYFAAVREACGCRDYQQQEASASATSSKKLLSVCSSQDDICCVQTVRSERLTRFGEECPNECAGTQFPAVAQYSHSLNEDIGWMRNRSWERDLQPVLSSNQFKYTTLTKDVYDQMYTMYRLDDQVKERLKSDYLDRIHTSLRRFDQQVSSTGPTTDKTMLFLLGEGLYRGENSAMGETFSLAGQVDAARAVTNRLMGNIFESEDISGRLWHWIHRNRSHWYGAVDLCFSRGITLDDVEAVGEILKNISLLPPSNLPPSQPKIRQNNNMVDYELKNAYEYFTQLCQPEKGCPELPSSNNMSSLPPREYARKLRVICLYNCRRGCHRAFTAFFLPAVKAHRECYNSQLLNKPVFLDLLSQIRRQLRMAFSQYANIAMPYRYNQEREVTVLYSGLTPTEFRAVASQHYSTLEEIFNRMLAESLPLTTELQKLMKLRQEIKQPLELLMKSSMDACSYTKLLHLKYPTLNLSSFHLPTTNGQNSDATSFVGLYDGLIRGVNESLAMETVKTVQEFYQSARAQQQYLQAGEGYVRPNGLGLTIYFSDLSIETVTKARAYDFWQLLSDIGGTMGLYFGCCVVTFFEIIFVCTRFDERLERPKRVSDAAFVLVQSQKLRRHGRSQQQQQQQQQRIPSSVFDVTVNPKPID